MTPEEKFGFSLSPEEAVAFLQRIGLSRDALVCDLTALERVLRAVLGRIPFHNFALLGREKKSPSVAEIKRDMLSGLGGPCGHQNPFLGALLHYLGFEVHLVAGSMMQPNCHLANLVVVSGKRYYCDAGDGRPYFWPMPVDEVREWRHPSHRWRTFPLSPEKMALEIFEQGQGWKHNCTVDLQLRPFSFFKDFIHRHYTQHDYGPFQTGFRLAMYPDGKIVGVRDMQKRWQENGEFRAENFNGCAPLFAWVEKNFALPLTPAGEAWAEVAFKALAQKGIEPFEHYWKARQLIPNP